MIDPKKWKFRNGQEVDFYCTSGGENGTDRKLRFPAFDRCQNYLNPMRIFAFRDGLENTKIAKKSRKKTKIWCPNIFLKNGKIL